METRFDWEKMQGLLKQYELKVHFHTTRSQFVAKKMVGVNKGL
jgi:hypothetical protein